MKMYKVDPKEVQRGLKVETKEHPTMSPALAKRTVTQHLQHHPMYYQLEPQFEKMLDRREKNMKPIPPRPKPVPARQRDSFF